MCLHSCWRAGPQQAGRGNTGGTMNIAGECRVCGYIFDPTIIGGCPACRTARVAEMFRPVDPLRTAMSAGYEFMRGKRFQNPYVHTCMHPNSGSCRACAYFEEQEQYDSVVPKGCKMPTGEAGQIWELRRIFRL